MLFLLLFVAFYLYVYKFTTLFRFFFLPVCICYLNTRSPPHSCSLTVVSDSWAVPLGSVCALDLSLDFSRASVPLCDFPYGLHIRLGCHRVLPSACLFSGSLGFTPKCGWVFFSKGICTFFSLLCSYSSYICRQSFPERGFSNPFSTAESEPSGFSNFGFILFL